MKIDVVSIFGDYLNPLRLSLVGKAVETGLVQLGVHDLRSWTHDRHRKVDDTPYGGGAGMVMMPEPWGAALDDLVGPSTGSASGARLIMLTPSGRSFTQAIAHELAEESHLIFACGRYEGIDARVADYAADQMRVDELSIGDYVLNGGEAAALVIIEAVVRLLPGVIGNPASLDEESHGLDHDGLLEYPAYTKPASWRGLEVPEVLFSGHHAKIAAWRRERAMDKTRERRPELVPPGSLTPFSGFILGEATAADAGELLTLQRAAYLPEGRLHRSFEIPPLTETLAELTAAIASDAFLVARLGARIVGSVRGALLNDDQWYVGRLMVAPDQQGAGVGAILLAAIEARAPESASSFRLTTGGNSARNVSFYTRRGYVEVDRENPPGEVPLLIMEKSHR